VQSAQLTVVLDPRERFADAGTPTQGMRERYAELARELVKYGSDWAKRVP
jgi:hypothetical protein